MKNVGLIVCLAAAALPWAGRAQAQGTPTVVLQCTEDGGTNCPARIPDPGVEGNQSLSSVLNVPADACPDVIRDVQVHVTAHHSWVGDLTVTLTHNTTLVVSKVVQGSADHDESCAQPDLDGLFGTSIPGSMPGQAFCNETRPSVGELRTARGGSDETVFLGENAAGAWTLRITDEDEGPYAQDRLVDWRLEIQCKAPLSAQPFRGSGPLQAAAVLALGLLALGAGAVRSRFLRTGGGAGR